LCNGKPLKGLNRNVSYMTQKDTLLPWRSSLDNAALPLEIKGMAKKERHELARQALSSLGLEEAEHLRPHQLSGGMRARLSLARSLLGDTDILLMDEPFAAVDALSRMRL
jgi:ABC-type nitrate/sulfonate/bicarbonate transport system ATPase subunit